MPAAFAQTQNVAQPASGAAGMQGLPPAWAYPWNPDFKPPPDDGTPRRVPDSAATYTLTQVRDLFVAPDWHPNDHPPMPDVVVHGRKPDVRACGSCHRVQGSGGPENASLAGLPAAYIVEQMADYKSGARTTSVPQRSAPQLMIALAKAATEAEVREAAAYFSALKPTPNIKVVETQTVPQTSIAGNFLAAVPGGATEPIGQRIVEVPVDAAQFALRDSRAQFAAYAPPGSIAKGESLVKSGGAGKTVACASCHGADLKGLGAVPGIAGRSPSYLVRQLHDYKTGARAGKASAQMKASVQNLGDEDMVSLAAYLASLKP
ncbi:c-type cytochrome [Oxalobacteraceae bacterium OM1]|nr:c-type cytochrome [Oxalobacteraceae bacterium OM1]